MTQQPKETCQRTFREPSLQTLFHIQTFLPHFSSADVVLMNTTYSVKKLSKFLFLIRQGDLKLSLKKDGFVFLSSTWITLYLVVSHQFWQTMFWNLYLSYFITTVQNVKIEMKSTYCNVNCQQLSTMFRGSPIYTKITNTVSTTTILGLCKCKWGNYR